MSARTRERIPAQLTAKLHFFFHLGKFFLQNQYF